MFSDDTCCGFLKVNGVCEVEKIKLRSYVVRADGYGSWRGQAQSRFQAAQMAQMALGTPPRVTLMVRDVNANKKAVVTGQSFTFR